LTLLSKDIMIVSSSTFIYVVHIWLYTVTDIHINHYYFTSKEVIYIWLEMRLHWTALLEVLHRGALRSVRPSSVVQWTQGSVLGCCCSFYISSTSSTWLKGMEWRWICMQITWMSALNIGVFLSSNSSLSERSRQLYEVEETSVKLIKTEIMWCATSWHQHLIHVPSVQPTANDTKCLERNWSSAKEHSCSQDPLLGTL